MELTKSNYLKHLPKFLEVLKRSEFISFDLEMTGITGAFQSKFDFPFDYHSSTFRSSNKYSIIQIGLCLFTPQSPEPPQTQFDLSHYEAYPFNFYVFPPAYKKYNYKTISMELQSVNFNVEMGGVDWNRWIQEGIPLHKKQALENIPEECFLPEQFPLKLNDYRILNDYDRLDFEEIWEEFVVWYESSEYLTGRLTQEDVFCFDKGKFNVFDLQTDVLWILLKFKDKVIKEKLDIWVLSNDPMSPNKNPKNKENKYQIFLLKVDQNQKENIENLFKEKRRTLLEEMRGFNIYWDHLVSHIHQRDLPMIGHNCFRDIQFLVSHLSKDLTEDYLDFKNTVSQLFKGGIYDTKAISKELGWSKLGLSNLYKGITDFEHSIPKTSWQDSHLQVVFHNAAYDAYITGVCFGNLAQRVKVENWKNLLKMRMSDHFLIDFSSSESDFFLKETLFTLKIDKMICEYVKGKVLEENLIHPWVLSKISRIISSEIYMKMSKFEKKIGFIIEVLIMKLIRLHQYTLVKKPRIVNSQGTIVFLLEIQNQENIEEMVHKLRPIGYMMNTRESYDYLLSFIEK